MYPALRARYNSNVSCLCICVRATKQSPIIIANLGTTYACGLCVELLVDLPLPRFLSILTTSQRSGQSRFQYAVTTASPESFISTPIALACQALAPGFSRF